MVWGIMSLKISHQFFPDLRTIRFILSSTFLVTLLFACTPSHAPFIGTRILWPPAPSHSLLEFKALYYTQSSLRSPQYPLLPGSFVGGDEITISRASGVVSDDHGKVYVSDTVQKNVFIFDFSSEIVRVLSFDHIFDKPSGMDIGRDGRLYVADRGLKSILVFDREGAYLTKIGNDKVLQRPMNVAVNAQLGRLYVSDARKNAIVVFSLTGEFLFQFGGPGKGDGRLAMPHGIRFGKDGNLYVADMLNGRIQVFDPDGSFVSSIGDHAPYQLELEYPRDIAFSSDGNLHIIDIKQALLVSCEPNGKLLLITGGNKHTSHPLGLSSPTGITISQDDTIYIVDQLNNRLTLWNYLGAGDGPELVTMQHKTLP